MRYQVTEPLKINDALYPSLILSDTSLIVYKIFRILSGTAKVIDNYKGITYKLSVNHLTLPSSTNARKRTQNLLLDNFDEDINLVYLNTLFGNKKLNSNNSYYERIYYELIKCLIAYFDKDFVKSFIYLYRIIESSSFSIPMIYASKSKSYDSSFEILKKYFTKDGGELSLFKTYIKSRKEDETIFKYTIDINLSDYTEITGDSEYQKHIFATLKSAANKSDLESEEEYNKLSFKFEGCLDLIVNVRNKYFHLLSGSNQQNYYSIKYLYPELLFESVVSAGINWISIILFDILKHDFEAVI